MALYNFQKRFVPPILAGEKTHTIRGDRKDGRVPVPGEILHLYTGLRQKGATLLMRPRCTRVQRILITSNAKILIDGEMLDESECHLLARRDGFKDYWDMMVFWNGRRPFKGNIIHWKFPSHTHAQGEGPCANVSAPDAATPSRAAIVSVRKHAVRKTTTTNAACSANPSAPASGRVRSVA